MVLNLDLWLLLFPTPMLLVLSLVGFKILCEMRLEEQELLERYKKRLLQPPHTQGN